MSIMLLVLLQLFVLVSCAPRRCDPGFRGNFLKFYVMTYFIYYHTCMRNLLHEFDIAYSNVQTVFLAPEANCHAVKLVKNAFKLLLKPQQDCEY